MKCTWVDCQNDAKHPQHDSNGELWANLCDEHNEQFNIATDSPEPKRLLSVWVKAQGGAKEATKRMMGSK